MTDLQYTLFVLENYKNIQNEIECLQKEVVCPELSDKTIQALSHQADKKRIKDKTSWTILHVCKRREDAKTVKELIDFVDWELRRVAYVCSHIENGDLIQDLYINRPKIYLDTAARKYDVSLNTILRRKKRAIEEIAIRLHKYRLKSMWDHMMADK